VRGAQQFMCRRRDAAAARGGVRAERDAVVVAERAHVGVDEVGPRRAQHSACSSTIPSGARPAAGLAFCEREEAIDDAPRRLAALR
jgi:hypothetical protein